jgi:adenylate cyclase
MSVDEGSLRISADELALRLGIGRQRVEQLARVGAIEADADGSFDPGDVHRVRLLLAFEQAGVPLDALLGASRAGAISLRYYDELHAPPGPLSEQTYADLSNGLGDARQHLPRLFAAFGLAEPEPGSRLTVADERIISDMLATLLETGQPDLALRTIRLFGEGIRRATDGALGIYGEAAARMGDDLQGLPTDELFDALLRPWARFARRSGALAAWLASRHLSRAIDEYSVIQSERILEDAGFVAPRLDVPPAIAFIDLTGFTRMTEEQGDEKAAATALRLGELATETVGVHGGRVVKLLGDGVLVRFGEAGAAAAWTLDALAALPAAGLPTAHAGIAAGPLITREGDVFGRTVNLAARVADVAPDGHVYTPEAVSAELDLDHFRLTPAGDADLPGIGRIALVDIATATGP